MTPEAPMATPEPRKRVNRAALDPTVAMMAEQQDDLRDGLLLRIDKIDATLAGFQRIGWALLGGFFVLQVVQIVIFAQLLGVDVRETAAATREIVSATTSTTIGTDATGAPSTVVTTTTPALAPSADTDAVDAQPEAP